MSKRIIEALSLAAQDFYNKISEQDKYSPFIDFLKKIQKSARFKEDTINADHLIVLLDLLKDDTINLSEDWLINPKLYTGDYTQPRPFKYLIYVLSVMNNNSKFRRYYDDLSAEDAHKLKSKVAAIPDYKTLQDLIQQYDAKQKSASNTVKRTPGQVWKNAQDNYKNINEGNDTPVDAALVIGNIIERLGGGDKFKEAILQLPGGEKIVQVLGVIADIYTTLKKFAVAGKDLSENDYKGIIAKYQTREFSQKPFKQIISDIASEAPRNIDKLIADIELSLRDLGVVTRKKTNKKSEVNPNNPDDMAPLETAKTNGPPKGQFGRAFK